MSDVPELSLPGNPPTVIFPNLPDNWRLRVGASLPLYTGGRLERLADAARSDVAAAGHDSEAARNDLAWETALAYWGLVTATESERVLREALAAYDAHLADARNRLNFGLAARNEVLAVEVDRNRADFLRIEAANLAAGAEANLARLLGLAPGTRVEAVERLEAQAIVPELEPLVTEALAARADRAALAARVDSADARARAEGAARLPQVALGGGFDYANPNRRILPPADAWKTSWDVGVALSWSVFDSGRTDAAEARAEARGNALREQLADLDRRVRLDVTRARLDLDSALARLRVASQGLEAAQENLRVASDRHREGVSPSSDRLDAESQLLRAQLDRTHALAAVRIAQAAIQRATGP
jgi:outer membrane protein TolC